MRKPQFIVWLMGCLWNAILFALLGGERIKLTPAKPARQWPRKAKRKTRRAQQSLENQYDQRLLGGQVIPGHVLDYLHEAKTAMARGEYGAARWGQRYARAWLKHHP